MSNSESTDDAIDAKLLELWEGMFGNRLTVTAGPYVINYKTFISRTKQLLAKSQQHLHNYDEENNYTCTYCGGTYREIVENTNRLSLQNQSTKEHA